MYKREDKIWRVLGIIERLGIGGDRPYPSSLNSNNNQSLDPWPYILNSIPNDLTISTWYLDSYRGVIEVYKIEDKIWRGLGE